MPPVKLLPPVEVLPMLDVLAPVVALDWLLVLPIEPPCALKAPVV